MPSTFDPLLRLELQANNENNGTWGAKTNTNLELLARAIAGHESISIAGSGDFTLSTSNAADDQAREAFITLTGALTGARNVIVPSASKLYVFRRNTTGTFNVTIKTAAGTGVDISPGSVVLVACDGSDVRLVGDAASNFLLLSGGTLTGDLTINKASPVLALQKSASGQAAQITGGVSTSTRWIMRLGNADAESGANAGSNFALIRHGDDGVAIDSALIISRATGGPTFSQPALWRTALGAGAVGVSVFQASTTADAYTALGGGAVGVSVFQAATTAAAYTALGGGAVGTAVFAAADAAAVRSAAQLEGGWRLISQLVAASTTALEFTAVFNDALYSEYMFRIISLVPSVNDSILQFQIGTGAGPSWQTTNYRTEGSFATDAAHSWEGGAGSAILLSSDDATFGISNLAGSRINARLEFESPGSNVFPQFRFHSSYNRTSTNSISSFVGSGGFNTATSLTAARFQFNAGVAVTGRICLLGRHVVA